MKRVFLVLPFVLAACAGDVTEPREAFVKSGASLSARDGACASNGFDQLGYNRCARIFNGVADGSDKNLDGTVWGNPTYAADRLVMKWNAEWDRGVAEGWNHPPYAAWETNEWNGVVPGGSGEVWHYKIKWIGSCGDDGTLTASGGYCYWGQFDVLLDQGFDIRAGDGLVRFAHSKPNGFGGKPASQTP